MSLFLNILDFSKYLKQKSNQKFQNPQNAQSLTKQGSKKFGDPPAKTQENARIQLAKFKPRKSSDRGSGNSKISVSFNNTVIPRGRIDPNKLVKVMKQTSELSKQSRVDGKEISSVGDGIKLFQFKEPRQKFEIRAKILEMKKLQSLDDQDAALASFKSKDDATKSTASSNQQNSSRYVPLDDSLDNRKSITKEVVFRTVKRVKTEVSHEQLSLSEESDSNDHHIYTSLGHLKTESIDESVPELFKSESKNELILTDLQDNIQGVEEAEEKVKLFLATCGMKENFIHILIENGFTEMDTILDIDQRDLDEMEIPKGFAIKLLKRIQEEKISQENFQSTQEDQLNRTLSTFTEGARHKYNNFLGEQSKAHGSNLEDRFTSQLNQDESEYDDCNLEEELKDQVNPFSLTEDARKHAFVSCQKKQKNTMPKLQSCSTSTTSCEFEMNTPTRLACFQCYTILGGEPLKSDFSGERNFCGDDCLKLYLLGNTIICGERSCQEVVSKSDVVLGPKSQYFCSADCRIKNLESLNTMVSNLETIQDVLPKDQQNQIDLNHISKEKIDTKDLGIAEDEECEIDLDFSDIY